MKSEVVADGAVKDGDNDDVIMCFPVGPLVDRDPSMHCRLGGTCTISPFRWSEAGNALTCWALPHPNGHACSAGYGVMADGTTTYVNASVCTVNYQPVNPPIVIDLPTPRNS